MYETDELYEPNRVPVAIAVVLILAVVAAGAYLFLRIASGSPSEGVPAVSPDETESFSAGSPTDPLGRLTAITQHTLQDASRYSTSTIEAVEADGGQYRVAVSCQFGDLVDSPEEFLQVLTISIFAGVYDYSAGVTTPKGLTVEWYRSPADYRAHARPLMEVAVLREDATQFLWVRIPPETLPDMVERYSVSANLSQ